MKITKITAFLAISVTLAACEGQIGGSEIAAFDGGVGGKRLSELKAGIWVDPHGCDHWIIDDGIEGYMSQRLDPEGKPVCSGIAPPGYITGDYKAGSDIKDIF